MEKESFLAKVTSSTTFSTLDPADYGAIAFAGGQDPVFNFDNATLLHDLFRIFYESGKPTEAFCHEMPVFRSVKNKDGEPRVKGKKVTGFTNGEEDDADKAAGTKIVPWQIEEEPKGIGANFQKADNWQAFVLTNGNLINGQQTMSGELVAQAVIN